MFGLPIRQAASGALTSVHAATMLFNTAVIRLTHIAFRGPLPFYSSLAITE